MFRSKSVFPIITLPDCDSKPVEACHKSKKGLLKWFKAWDYL